MTCSAESSEICGIQPTVSSPGNPLCGRHAVRWYVMTLPAHRGLYTGNPDKELRQEQSRRIRNGEPSFDYFAPTFVEARQVNGRMVDTHRPLLYNYVFLHSSESEIYRIKQRLPHYNFLPRISDGEQLYHYPYLSDDDMRNLQWVARSYAGPLPVCAADPAWLITGDRIRFVKGRFENIEADIVARPGSRHKEMIMVCIDNCMRIPLLNVRPEEYVLIELSHDPVRRYSHLSNDRLQRKLHEALCRYHDGAATEGDRALAAETLRQYASLTPESDAMRCRLYSLLLPAYTLLGDGEACEGLIGMIRMMLPAVKAEQARALLLVTLYGCTDNSIYYDMAHKLVDPWRNEPNLRKLKTSIIDRLDCFDYCLNHRSKQLSK